MLYDGPDKIDLALIDLLQTDGLLSVEKLRDSLSERRLTRLGDVGQRIRRLKREGLIHIGAVPDYERIGFPLVSLVFVRTARLRNRTLAATNADFEERIRTGFPSIILSHKTEGKWSYVLKMLARDKLHFDQLHAELTQLEAVDDIETVSVIGQFKAPVPIHLVRI